METPILPFVIPRDCLNGQAIGGSPLEVEAEDSDPYCPPGRVPHVCAGVAGALHGLNKMGRSPFQCLSFPCSEAKEREEPITCRAERYEADLSRPPRLAVGRAVEGSTVSLPNQIQNEYGLPLYLLQITNLNFPSASNHATVRRHTP
jgi:hypothetical protein